jgi:hypothetical protein
LPTKRLIFTVAQSTALLGFVAWLFLEFHHNEYLQSFLGGYPQGYTIVFSVSFLVVVLVLVSLADLRKPITLPTNGVSFDKQFSGATHTAPASEATPTATNPQEAGDSIIKVPKESPLANFIERRRNDYRNVEIPKQPSRLSKLRNRVRDRNGSDDSGA